MPDPACPPPAVTARLNAAAMGALADPEVRAKRTAQGAQPLGSTPGQYGQVLRGEAVRWGQAIAGSGGKLQ